MSRTALVILAAAAAVAGALAWAHLARLWHRWTWARRRARGRQGERQAPAVLAAAGYRVLDDQVEQQAVIVVDGQARTYTVRADFLAERNGARYVVEVKTGHAAPDPLHSATRRQLLEYRVVYDADGVVLVDMEAERLHEVRFPALAGIPARRNAAVGRIIAAALGAGLVLGGILGYLIAHG